LKLTSLGGGGRKSKSNNLISVITSVRPSENAGKHSASGCGKNSIPGRNQGGASPGLSTLQAPSDRQSNCIIFVPCVPGGIPTQWLKTRVSRPSIFSPRRRSEGHVQMRRNSSAIAGGVAGFVVTAIVYLAVAMLLGNLMRGVYGESELGSTPLLVAVIVCLIWLGLPVALCAGTVLGIRISGGYNHHDSPQK
jgi:hypothetical protein